MRQRTALIIAIALTAFMLVIAASIATRLAVAPATESLEPAPSVTPPAEATASAEPSSVDYQQALQTANAQLEQANRQLQDAYQRLTAQASTPVTATVAATVVPPAVLPEQAATLAAAAVPGAVQLGTPELVDFNGSAAYAVTFEGGTVYVDANSGQIVFNELAAAAPAQPSATGVPPPAAPAADAAPAAAQISADQAVAIASTYAGRNGVERVRLEEEHGQMVYEVRFADNSRVYVDPVTGRVIYARLEEPDDD